MTLKPWHTYTYFIILTLALALTTTDWITAIITIAICGTIFALGIYLGYYQIRLKVNLLIESYNKK